MSLNVGSRIAHYEVTALIGEGSMGQVYEATDTKLNRQVALKILPEAFAADPDRLARFQREAQVLASLNHPGIAAIYGIEEQDDTRALVLELVEGPTLADRIARGPLPVDETLAIAKQIAEALEAAHEAGVIHRDLKPANIKVRDDGTVKVLDFGLAKALQGEASGGPSESSTLTAAPTATGIIMGTAAYMSPEQARGQSVDRRTDIWAFGCVMYEMLTGRVAFEGQGIVDTIAATLGQELVWEALPVKTPAGVRRLLRRCLDKDRTRRLHDIADARIEIDEAQSAPPAEEYVAASAPARRGRLAWMSVAGLALLAGGALGVWVLSPGPTAPEARLDINTPPTRDPSMALSPDGLAIVFVATGSARQAQLWLRSLDATAARPLAGTEGATRPFWSPDSRSIGFFADSRLKRLDIDTGSLQTVVALSDPLGLGGSWNSDGTIVFSNTPGRPIFRISANGGEPVEATRFESPRHSIQASPVFLPDGRHFLFFVGGSPEARGVYLGQLDDTGSRRLFDADTSAAYAATGHVLFIRGGQLLAQVFDPDRLELKGEPFPVAEQVPAGTRLSASAAGPIAYRLPSTDSGERQLVWVDRSGVEMDKVVYPDTAALGPALSHDGRHVAVFRSVNGNMDVWLYEVGRRGWDRFTSDSSDDIYALWSPDDTRIAFASNRNTGYLNIYSRLRSEGPGSEELLLLTPLVKFPMDWSSDGRFLLFDSLDPQRRWDIWALPMDGSRTPFEVVQTDFNERLGQFSPDGQWIAYQSDRTGRFEIYLRPFPGPGGDFPVSTDGGAQVRWNPRGEELFYVAADDRLMTVPIRVSSSGQSVDPGLPSALFATTVGSTAINTNRHQYAVSSDGQSFVMNSAPEASGGSPITVILNWEPQRSDTGSSLAAWP